jgi:hypothetical protein
MAQVLNRWFVSCWRAGEALTDLMWQSYGGHKGGCISCDGPGLLKQLGSVSRGASERAGMAHVGMDISDSYPKQSDSDPWHPLPAVDVQRDFVAVLSGAGGIRKTAKQPSIALDFQFAMHR